VAERPRSIAARNRRPVELGWWRLLREHHRSIVETRFGRGSASFDPLGGGWAHDTYLADGAWVFQFPRAGEEEAMQRQIALLPELAARVSAPIPVPVHVSIDPLCMGYRAIEGLPFDEVGEAGAWPEQLGRFLTEVHAVPPEAVGLEARGPASLREALRARLVGWRATIVPRLRPAEREAALDLFAACVDDDAIWRIAPRLTHGDVGAEHILVTPRGALAGVIDWGDASVGDPVGDLAWLLHGAPAIGERVLAAYGGEPDPHLRPRARLWFALMPWYEVEYGIETSQPAFVESGLAGVVARLP